VAGLSARALLLLGTASLGLYLALATAEPLRFHLAVYFSCYTALFGLYLVAVVGVVRSAEADRPSRPRLLLILAFGVIFRLVLIPTEPSLSDDMFRYVWDGRVQAAGLNPYAYPPGAPELASLRDPQLWPKINRKEFITVYPPGSELGFAAIYALHPESVPWTKLALCLVDLTTLLPLLLLLRRRGLRPERALIYAWSPLVVVEFAHGGHSDALLLPFLLAGLLLLERRPGLAGLLLGAAAAIKLLPALLIGAFVRRAGWWRLALGAGLVVGLAFLPYLGVGGQVLDFLPKYFQEEFNSGLYRLTAVTLRDWLGPAGPLLVRQVSGLSLLGLLLFLALRRSDQAPERTALTIFGLFLLLTPNLHPWYVTWLVPLCAPLLRPGRLGLRFEPVSGWLLLSGLVALGYIWFVQEKPEYWALAVEHGSIWLCLLAPWLGRAPSTLATWAKATAGPASGGRLERPLPARFDSP
jgi:alpha-1,6-mannosyltransferase